MTSAAILVTRIRVQTWLAKAPFLALIVAIAAFGPLLSFDQAQHNAHNAIDAEALNATQAGSKPWNISAGVAVAVAGFAGMAFGASNIVTGSFRRMSNGVFNFNAGS